VALDEQQAARLAGTTALRRDDDVLDTWFSSGLWPLSTLGWPSAKSHDTDTFYPTDVLVTGFDILFFWVARMVMLCDHFSGQVPFRSVHLTGLVRDASGEKMSKTKGNVLDPMDLVAEYGADAVRFTLCALDSPGRDIPLDPERMAGYRAFGNKIWNATRFALSRIGSARVQTDLDASALELPERWILSRCNAAAAEVNEKFATYRYDEACHRLYHFFWGDLCDWYIELCKPALSGDAPRPLVGEVLLTVLERSLRLLHPVMPHLTEELWQRLPGVDLLERHVECQSIAVARYPSARADWHDPAAEAAVDVLQAVIGAARALRTERGLERQVTMRLLLEGGSEEAIGTLIRHAPLVAFLARVDAVERGTAAPGAARDRIAGIDVAFEISRPELGPDERARLEKELAKVESEIDGAERRLANADFMAKAPPQVVAGAHARRQELVERRQRLNEQLRVQ
jgi:valyl-tRNA synthetase